MALFSCDNEVWSKSDFDSLNTCTLSSTNLHVKKSMPDWLAWPEFNLKRHNSFLKGCLKMFNNLLQKSGVPTALVVLNQWWGFIGLIAGHNYWYGVILLIYFVHRQLLHVYEIYTYKLLFIGFSFTKLSFSHEDHHGRDANCLHYK